MVCLRVGKEGMRKEKKEAYKLKRWHPVKLTLGFFNQLAIVCDAKLRSGAFFKDAQNFYDLQIYSLSSPNRKHCFEM